MIAGIVEPDSGSVEIGETIRIGYLRRKSIIWMTASE